MASPFDCGAAAGGGVVAVEVEFELKGRDVILATRLPGEEDPAARDITELAYSWTIRDARSRPKFREAMRAAGMLGNRTSSKGDLG